MRTYLIIAGFIACWVIFADGHHQNKQVSGLAEAATSAAVTAVRKSETVTTQTETVVEETVEETVETTTWQQNFVTSFASWKSLDLKSVELKDKVSVCFSETVNGFTYWEKIAKNSQYVEFLAAATGYSGKSTDISGIKEHCVKIAASKPRLLALAFKSISKHMKNSKEKLVVSKLAKKKYNIGEKVIEVKKDWKQFAISNFLNFKSDEGNSKELITKVTTVLEYDSTYFDKFIKKKIYAEYLAHATGYTGDIKKCEELKNYLKTTAKSKPRLVALALKYLAKNLKNSKVELTISPTAIKRFGIKQKSCKKVDWKSHFISEYHDYKSTQKYKEADQRLRVSSMLNYEADGGTILDLILKRKQYKEFFAKSIGYSYSESSFDEKDFREYVKTTSELYPTLVSLSFRSICKNLKSNEKLVIAASAEKIIKEKLTKKETTETKKSKKITKTTTTTTTTKTWEEYVINEFSSFKSMSEDSSEVKEKVKNFLGYSTNGYSCLEKILKRESYAEYLAHSTGFKGNYKETEKLIKHLESIGKSKPRLLACSLKYVTKNIANSSEKLVVSKVAQEKYKIENKVFEAKLDWKKYAIKEFANWKSESGDSSEIKSRVTTILQYDETYWNKILSNTKYFEYLRISTGYKGSSTDVNAFKTHFQKICNEKPRLAALSIKKLAKHFQNSKEKLTVSRLAKTKYNIQETEIVKTDWTSYAVKNFANFESEKDKSHLIKARLIKLINLDADGSTYLDKVLKRTVYAEYISRATGFTGDWRKPERLRDYLKTIIESRPRLVACAFKYIAKNHQDSKSELVISEVAKTRFNIGKNKWAGYAIANFADFKTAEDKSHLIRARIQKLVGLEAEGSTYLEKILENTSYAEYFAKSTGYTGDCKNTQEFKKYITEVIREKPRLIACTLKYIAKNQADTKAALKISNVAKNRFKIGQTTTTSTTTENTTVTKSSQSTSEVSTSSTSYTTYLTKYFKDVTETSRKSEELVSIIENFRVAENGDILTEVLKNTEYINYLKTVTRYSGQDNISEFRNFLQNEFFRKRPRFIALAFKQILLYSEGSSSLVAPTYCDNYWKQEETRSVTSSNQSTSSSQTVTEQSSSSTVSISTSNYLKNFMNIQSASSEKTKITEIVSEFAKGSYLDEILKESAYAKYLAATLEYTEDYNNEAFRVYIKKTILKDRPLALALSLKKIYYHICNEQELVIPRYVSTKYQITESDYSVSSSSSSSYTTYSSSSSTTETVVE